MKILDKEIDFNFEEAENIDKAVKLDEKYTKELEKAVTLTQKCEVYKNFFDELIGNGTSEELFGDKNNFFQITDAYQELIKEAENVYARMAKAKAKFSKKYERYVK